MLDNLFVYACMMYDGRAWIQLKVKIHLYIVFVYILAKKSVVRHLQPLTIGKNNQKS